MESRKNAPFLILGRFKRVNPHVRRFGFCPALFADELLKHEQEQARLNEARKISVVNVNPTNIRPHSDTPEIRKYKKRFNSEILCAALWGEAGRKRFQTASGVSHTG